MIIPNDESIFNHQKMFRTHLPILLLLFNFFFFSHFSDAQRFNAGFKAGLNFSELEGDEITDYYGLNIGAVGKMLLSKHWQIGTELLFSQNGEYLLPKFHPVVPYGKIRLNHIEIPIYSEWLIGVFEKEKFLDWRIQAGVAYTKLMSYKTETSAGTEISEQIEWGNKNAWMLQFGTSYFFTKHFGVNFKVTQPLTIGLGPTLAFRMEYLIF